MKKRILSALLALALIIALVPALKTDVRAAGGLALDQLQAKFPSGKYWNHYVSNESEAGDYLHATRNESFSDTISSTMCASHTTPSYSYYVGKYDCNYFDEGMQCCGFARKLAYDAYGTRASGWGTSSTVKPGDVVWFKSSITDSTYGHWVFVYAVSGNYITVGECNYESNLCKIRWGHTYDMSSFYSYTIYSAPYTLPMVSEKLDVGDNFYARIKSVSSQKYLTDQNSNVVISAYDGSDEQLWYFDRQSDGTYYIAAASGNALDVYDASAEQGSNVQTWGFHGGAAQKWYLTSDEKGYIFGAICTGCIMDVADSGTEDGTNVIMWNNHGADNQRFEIEVVEDLSAYPQVSSDHKYYALGQSVTLSWPFVPGSSRFWIDIWKWDTNYHPISENLYQNTSYTFTPTQPGKYTVYVTGRVMDASYKSSYTFTVTETPNPFSDVKNDDWFYDPVQWAIEQGITTGASATTFNPDGQCLRAQVVTFLHRAAGNPDPTSVSNPFTDVKSSDFFYKPVLWAVEKGITNGVSATEFGSYSNCNRAAVVTFLWRAAGSPEPASTDNPFTDVNDTDFFYKPVLWAIENGITNGLTADTFGPTAACNRAQVVTFLYRAYN